MRDKRRERQSEGERESKAQTALSLTAILHSFHIISSLITHRLSFPLKNTHTPLQKVPSGPPYTILAEAAPSRVVGVNSTPLPPPYSIFYSQAKANRPLFSLSVLWNIRTANAPARSSSAKPAVKARGAEPGQNDWPVTGRQALEPRNNRRPLLTGHWGLLFHSFQSQGIRHTSLCLSLVLCLKVSHIFPLCYSNSHSEMTFGWIFASVYSCSRLGGSVE